MKGGRRRRDGAWRLESDRLSANLESYLVSENKALREIDLNGCVDSDVVKEVHTKKVLRNLGDSYCMLQTDFLLSNPQPGQL